MLAFNAYGSQKTWNEEQRRVCVAKRLYAGSKQSVLQQSEAHEHSGALNHET